MDCREFRKHHLDLLDGTLAEIDTVRAQRHQLECRDCAEHDARIRRALLVFRNVPEIAPSHRFTLRLNEKLAEVRAGVHASPPATSQARLPIVGAIAFAAGVAFMAVLNAGSEASNGSITVAAADETPLQLASPAIAASMSAGMPISVALLMAESASRQLAEAEAQFSAYETPLSK